MKHLKEFDEYLIEGFFSKNNPKSYNNIHDLIKRLDELNRHCKNFDNSLLKWFDNTFDTLSTNIGTHGLKLSYEEIMNELDVIMFHGKTVCQWLPIIKILNGDLLCINLDDKKFPVNIFSHEDNYSKNKKVFDSVLNINKDTKIDSSVSYY